MKKPFAILLLFLLTYNMMGYYLMFAIRHYQVKQTITQQIAQSSITENNLLLLKVPVNLPYMVNWSDYEKVQGSFVYQGRFFEKVKQILRNDTMYVYCVEDKNQNNLFADLQQHTREQLPDLADLPHKSEQKQVFSFLKEYLPIQPWQFVSTVDICQLHFITCYQSINYQIKLEAFTPPPQFS